MNEGIAIVRHQSGDLYAYEENSLTGSRGYGPLHHTEVPTSPTEVLDILDNNAGHDLEADGNWLFDEIEAGRAVPVAPERVRTRLHAPGEYITEEIEARQWTVAELAPMLHMSTTECHALIAGAPMRVATAEKLAAAFGTSQFFWLNLEHAWRKWKLSEGGHHGIGSRARGDTQAGGGGQQRPMEGGLHGRRLGSRDDQP